MSDLILILRHSGGFISPCPSLLTLQNLCSSSRDRYSCVRVVLLLPRYGWSVHSVTVSRNTKETVSVTIEFPLSLYDSLPPSPVESKFPMAQRLSPCTLFSVSHFWHTKYRSVSKIMSDFHNNRQCRWEMWLQYLRRWRNFQKYNI